MIIGLAAVAAYATVAIVAYTLGKTTATADARAQDALQRKLEQEHRDSLAREIDELTAAMNGRPVGGVGEVLPLRRREQRGDVA